MPYPPFPTEASEHTLAQTLSRLFLDAGSDVADPDAAVGISEELIRRTQNATLPLVIE